MFTSGSPNSGQLQIGIALVLQDRFSNQAREASTQIRRLHQEAKIATNANLNAVRDMASQGAAIGAAVTVGLWGAVKQGANFIDTMTQVGAIAKKDGTTIEELFKMAQSLGKETMFSSQDIASGMQYFAMAGMSTKEIKDNIAGAAYLAGAVKHDLGGKGGAADLMTNIMKMFQIPSSKESAARVADLLTTGVTRANMSLMDLAETIKYAGTTGVNLGASLEQIIAFSGILGNAGLQGSMAGTAVSNAYRYLTRSIEDSNNKGYKALSSMGLGKKDFIDAEGRLIDLGEAMVRVSEATKGMGDTTRMNKLVDIFGVRGERGATVMMRSVDNYRDLLKELQTGSQGRAQSIMEQRMGTIAGAIETMSSTFENLQTTYTSTIAPLLTPMFQAVGTILEIIRAIVGAPVIGYLIVSFITLATVIATVRLGLLALRASWKLTFNDSLVSLRNMFTVMQAGWRGATISAAQYASMQGGIITQQRAGIFANGASAFGIGAAAATRRAASQQAHGAMAMATANRGTWQNGMLVTGQGARTRYFMRDANGGVTRTTHRGALVGVRRQFLNAGPGSAPYPPRTMGNMLGTRGVVGLLGKGLTGLTALLGGPLGLALIAGTMLLPPLITKVSEWISSSKDNTNAVKASTDIERQKLAEERRKNKGLTGEEQLILMISALQDLTNSLKSNVKPAYTVVINMDGKQVIKKIVKDTLIEETVNAAGK